MTFRALLRAAFALAIAHALIPAAQAEKRYGPGVTDSEIKIGQTMPYSGPLSAYGAIGRAQQAYFAKVNAEGGINGRKVNLISLDDGYNPAKTVEHVRKLVEAENVLLIFSSVGTSPNMAVRKYLNGKKVPHLFVAGGDTAWGDYKNFPWTMGWMPPYHLEGKIYAQHILKTRPTAKVAVLSLNDEYGKDYVRGFKEGLGDKSAKMIVAERTYELFDTTLDTQILSLKESGADTLFSAMAGRHASQAIRKISEIGWKPVHYTGVPSASVDSVLVPAGLDRATGLLSAYYAKDPTNAALKDDAAAKQYIAWAKKYLKDGDPGDGIAHYGYQVAQALEYVLKKCGDDLTRENIMKQATSLKDVELPMLLPGVKVNTSATDYYPIKQFVLMRFDGKEWVPFGDILTEE